MQNRAMEMLTEAYGLIPYSTNRDTAQMLVRLAMGEVQELLDRLERYDQALAAGFDARLEARPAGGVLIDDARVMVAARLVASPRPRAALPGNGRSE